MEETISFEDLGLDESTLVAVAAKGFENPSPIQVLAIPRLLNGDANVIAKARTGTGKTAAFGIPLVQTITEDAGHIRALVLTPTRELALQVCKEVESLTTRRYPRLAPVYGGQSMGEQLRKLRSGVEIVVGTPGRVKDHLDRGSLLLDKIDYFILDEADEMLDMGFIEDIEYIFSKANSTSRVLLFSATMPHAILKIASQFMGEYEIVEEEERPEEPILTEQRYWMVRESEKINALVRLIDISPEFYGLIFTQTKSDADTVAKELDDRGYEAAALHGDIPQSQREKILGRFRRKKTRILVATDVAARGIDIEGLTHVVNYAMPFDGPTYVHRIGRTGRAGARGLAFTLVRPEERRKISYLCGVSKGNLKEGKVPTVEEVLKVKRDRLFEDTIRSLGFDSENPPATPVDPLAIELGDDTEAAAAGCQTSIAADAVCQEGQSVPLKKIGKSFVKLATRLCENREPLDVLAAVLENAYSEHLDPQRYGLVTTIHSGQGGFGGKNSGSRGSGGRNSGGGADAGQMRLYVGIGRRDGYGRADVARYFSDLLHIPGRLVDRIEVTENFSLVSLPSDAGRRALDLSKQNKSLPHMHVDARSNEGQGGSGYYGGNSRPHFAKRGQKRDLSPQQYRTSDASLYRKDGYSGKKHEF